MCFHSFDLFLQRFIVQFNLISPFTTIIFFAPKNSDIYFVVYRSLCYRLLWLLWLGRCDQLWWPINHRVLTMLATHARSLYIARVLSCLVSLWFLLRHRMRQRIKIVTHIWGECVTEHDWCNQCCHRRHLWPNTILRLDQMQVRPHILLNRCAKEFGHSVPTLQRNLYWARFLLELLAICATHKTRACIHPTHTHTRNTNQTSHALHSRLYRRAPPHQQQHIDTARSKPHHYSQSCRIYYTSREHKWWPMTTINKYLPPRISTCSGSST